MKLISYITLFLLSFTSVNDKEKVAWEEGSKLSWSMFKGSPENLSGFVASTNSGISVSFSVATRDGKVRVNYEVQSYFYPNNSWYKRGHVNAYVLAHEQTHFDISELFSRKLKQEFSVITKDKNFQSKAEKVYQQNEQERVVMQQLFDEESDHSRDSEQEEAWEAFVQKEIKKYDAWK
ncbi:MAG: hypothetical protein ACI849_000733 [Patiriisocius sp.]|jgi:hypothetical protein